MLHDDGLNCERLFYIKLRGLRSQAKQVVLNECLTYCAIKWTCLSGKRKGDILESSSFEQNMRVLFRTFTQHGMQYDFRRDFNDNGEFHGAVMAKWSEQKKVEPKFATHQFRAKVDFEADNKIREAQRSHIISPFQDLKDKESYMWLVRMIVWILGCYMCTRGGKDIAKILWSEIKFDHFKSGPDAGIRYLHYVADEVKNSKRTLNKPSIDPDSLMKKVRETPNNPLDPLHDPCDPYRIFHYFRTICPPEQVRLFCMFQTKPQSLLCSKSNIPFRTNPTQPIGETPLGKAVSELAVKCDFDNPLRFTNHGAKALGHCIVENAPVQVPLAKRLQHSNHANPTAGIPYQAENDVAEKILQDAMIHNTVPIQTNVTSSAPTNLTSSAPTPAHLNVSANNTTQEHISTSYPLSTNPCTSPPFHPPRRPTVHNPYKRHSAIIPYSQQIFTTPPTPDASLKLKINQLQKEKVCLQAELAFL